MNRSSSAPFRHLTSARALLGGCVALAALLASLHLLASGAEAQRGDDSGVTTTSYDLKLVDELIITDENLAIKEVILLGEDNVYLLESDKRIDVYRLNVDGASARNVRMGTINLEDPIREILVLDDKSSFLIRTRKGLAVYSVTKQETLVQSR
ncbi:MAG: hypothetical protein RLY93_08830 [Sumerlaeia bacterium]